MATAEEARAARDAKLDALHEQLTDAVDRLVSGDDWRRAIEFAAKFRTRSFSNSLLIARQHFAAFEAGRVPDPEPTYVAGYKQWQTLGRQVLKGQPGYMILAPVTGRFATTTPSDADSWRRLEKFEKPRAGEVVRSRMVGVRPAYVWDVSSTNGDAPVPELSRPVLLEGQAPEGLWAGLATVIAERGFAVCTVPDAAAIGGANGVTNFTDRTVSVWADMDDLQKVKTLSHELAHIDLGHEARMGGDGWHRGIGEVEAESVAAMIGAAHGVDTSIYTLPYVSGWASSVKDKTAVEVVQATGERVRKSASAILDALPTVQLGGGDPPGLSREPRATERAARRDAERATTRATVAADAFAAEPARRSPGRESVVRSL
ncbi:ssDNA-binding domain-containing protein [Microbacterium sp. F2E]|uniref:ArdC family protein n=1 Tax=Microbacterium sp. F2E TaxID=2895284 RepID=UPI001E4B015D|nr:ArdC family protein [Microbacterium sp. F2E]MCC9053520.1 ssDNA-binding domain-containing protein [Microbacterium sp. F2E]